MTTGAANITDNTTAQESRAALQTRETLAGLKARYPWPTERPSESPILWSLDYGGRRLITDAIASRGVSVLLEIGSFLGGSARQWLAASREVVVVCVDPWPDLIDSGRGIAAHHIGRAYRDQLRAPEGVYRSFLSSMWDVRHRIVHVRGMSLDVLPELHSLGLRPDMVYIDADKKGHEIPVCDELFPDAVIAGDDWNWSDGFSFPIREPAYRSARKRGRRLKCVGTTWLIDDGPWTIRERLLQLQSSPRSLTQAAHSLMRRLNGTTSSGRRR
jgi:predicted O-methyltransferase YrrM